MAKGSEMSVKCVREGFTSLAKEVKKAVGGGKVVLFAEEGREADDAIAALGVEGFTVVKSFVRSSFLGDYARLKDLEYPESVGAAIGVGSAAATESAKAFTGVRQVPIFLFPTSLSALSCLRKEAAFVSASGFLRFYPTSVSVLIDRSLLLSGRGAAAGLGYFLARFVGVWDGAYERLSEKGESPTAAFACLKSAAEVLSGLTEENAPEKILASTLRLEHHASESGLFVSGSAQTFSALLSRKTGAPFPDCSFYAAYTLLRLYDYYLGKIPLDHALPPDRAQSIELLSSLCKMDASALYLRNDLLYSREMEEKQYVTAEYKEDFAEAIRESALSISLLCRVFRRLSKKEDIRAAIATETLLSLVSLTGEMVSGYPLIKHIKLTGLIEPLLNCA